MRESEALRQIRWGELVSEVSLASDVLTKICFGDARDTIPGGDSGGKGKESKRQHRGKVWRFDAAGENRGNGADLSVEKLGLEVIAGSGVGGVVGWEERMMSRD